MSRNIAAFSMGGNDGRVVYPNVLRHSIDVKELRNELKAFADEDRIAVYHDGKGAVIDEIKEKEGVIQFVPGHFSKAGRAEILVHSLTVGQLKEKIKSLPDETKVIGRDDGYSAAIFGVTKLAPNDDRA